MDDIVRILSDLVSIPSMNPMGRDRTGPMYAEDHVADYVATYLRRKRVDVQIEEVSSGRPNVIGYIDAGSRNTIMLEAHFDTVQADSMTIAPFRPEIRDGKLYGRGSCDTKASLAAFMHTACRLAETSGKLACNVLLLGVSDEEYSFTGARQAVARGIKADFGIVGEPTGLHIVRAHKGVTRWRIVTKGQSVHAAYPEKGENAIYTMGRILTRLEQYAAGLQIAPGHPLLGARTISVGVIEGGQAVNVVPDHCWIDVDRRTLPGETLNDILHPIRRLLEDVDGWTLESPYLSVAGMEVGRESPAVRKLDQAISSVLGNAVVETANYATDAGFYNAAGVPTVVFGPGHIDRAHTSAEFVELEEVHHAVAIIERLLS
jgi:acetylornithine deacetylase/succinyl-diaminopimelate desuccinylase family protein